MSAVVGGHYSDNKENFEKFLKQIEGNAQSLKNKFQYSADQVNKFIKFTPVFATWNDNREVDSIKLSKAIAVEKEDGWHLLGYDIEGIEYCIGGAVVTCSQILYKP
jgi:hypothetical protein